MLLKRELIDQNVIVKLVRGIYMTRMTREKEKRKPLERWCFLLGFRTHVEIVSVVCNHVITRAGRLHGVALEPDPSFGAPL